MTSISQPSPQLLLVGEKDTKRLLEVYVKRSLSLNDGSQSYRRQRHRMNKWVTMAEKKKRDRRHSSDTSLNSQTSVTDGDVGQEPCTGPESGRKAETLSRKTLKKWKIKRSLSRKNSGTNALEKSKSKSMKLFKRDKGKEDDRQPHNVSAGNTADVRTEMSDKCESSAEEKKNKAGKKSKKFPVWKSFLNWFSKGSQEKDKDLWTAEKTGSLSNPSTTQSLTLPETLLKSEGLRRSKSLRKKQSNRRLSKWRQSEDMSTEKFIEMVESTNSYYEKVSEELEKIVHEVKDSPANENAAFQLTGQQTSEDYEDVKKRITELIKQEGDLIDKKLKEQNIVLWTALLDSFSYRSFQQMADQYVQTEVPDVKTRPAVAAPELVKFAFTLDFTARVANLHRQATGQIMGFGNKYLQDRFTHMSESHAHLTDNKTDGQKSAVSLNIF